MSAPRVALPTPELLREQPVESGGWSQFFDAVFAALDRDEAREAVTVCHDPVTDLGVRL